MREMTEREIRDFIKSWKWCTVIAVEGDKPYAVEVSYGSDDNYIYCGTRPGGRMARAIKENPNVAIKICSSDPRGDDWLAVIVEGKAERLTKKEDIMHSVRQIAKSLGRPENALDAIGERIAANPEKSNSLRIPIKKISGMAHT